MIVDIHTRIGQHPLHEFRQTPEELLAIMNEHSIDMSFLLPFPTMKIQENNDMIAEAVREHADRFIGFAGIDPTARDALEEVERAISLGLKGIMLDPDYHKFFRGNMSRVEVLMVSCMEYDLPVLINTENIVSRGGEPYFKALDQLAFKFPDIRMIVHLNWPRVGELMRAHRNIILYTGGHHNTPGPIPRIAEVGPTRICLGTESPVNHPALTIRDIRAKKIDPVFRELILGKNAERLFKDLF
jgi:predicted TIM-barrel fold metal-dependent hydrolase